MNNFVFTYKGKDYPVVIVRKNNKNTYIRIKDGNVNVTTSYFTTKKSIQNLIQKSRKSIEKMIDKVEKKEERARLFLLLGQEYQVIYGNFSKKVEISGNTLYARDEKTLEKWYQEMMTYLYTKRLDYWYRHFSFKIPVPNLKIRKMTSRWGVCNTRNHNITLNSELMRYSEECLDYVIVHELSHFIEPNHSKKFWSVVEKNYPNYKNIRKKLRESC